LHAVLTSRTINEMTDAVNEREERFHPRSVRRVL
jgi:hypothetical protein